MHLIYADDLADGFVLAGDQAAEFGLKVGRRTAVLLRIQAQAAARVALFVGWTRGRERPSF
jgi:hypothetical protein